jgi:hypothetical protein
VGGVIGTAACIKQSFTMFDNLVEAKGYVLGGSQRVVSTPDSSGASPLYTDPPTAFMRYLASFAQAFIASSYPNLKPGADYSVFPFPSISGATTANVVRFSAGDMMPASVQRAWWDAMLQLVQDPTKLDSILDSLTSVAQLKD